MATNRHIDGETYNLQGVVEGCDWGTKSQDDFERLLTFTEHQE